MANIAGPEPKNRPTGGANSLEVPNGQSVKNRLGRNESDFCRDWGCFFSKLDLKNLAIKNFDKSLEEIERPSVYYHRAIVKRMIGNIGGALEDAQKARGMEKFQKYYEEEGSALFEMNEFEDAKRHLHNSAVIFKKRRVLPFMEKIISLDEVFKDCMSKRMGEFLIKNSKIVSKVAEDIQSKQNPDKRPLWKVRKDQNQCDITSFIEQKKKDVSFLESERCKANFKNFSQTYMPRTWKDILFMKKLRKDEILKKSKLDGILNENYKTTLDFVRMLEARSPLYNENGKKYDSKVGQKMHCDYLFRTQNDCRRIILTILQHVRELKNSGNVENLQKFIEESMREHVVKISERFLPWKFQFINEVYNLLGLAYADVYIQENNDSLEETKRLSVLLKMPLQRPEQETSNNVGSNLIPKKDIDNSAIQEDLKKQLAKYEKRIRFSKYAIERCYLNYESSSLRLKHNNTADAYTSSLKALKEAQYAHNFLWQFLCTMQIVRYHTHKGELLNIKSVLINAKNLANILGNDKLTAFVDICLTRNQIERVERGMKKVSSVSSRDSRHRSIAESML